MRGGGGAASRLPALERDPLCPPVLGGSGLSRSGGPRRSTATQPGLWTPFLLSQSRRPCCGSQGVPSPCAQSSGGKRLCSEALG